jgi:hypothetical protein
MGLLVRALGCQNRVSIKANFHCATEPENSKPCSPCAIFAPSP